MLGLCLKKRRSRGPREETFLLGTSEKAEVAESNEMLNEDGTW